MNWFHCGMSVAEGEEIRHYGGQKPYAGNYQSNSACWTTPPTHVLFVFTNQTKNKYCIISHILHPHLPPLAVGSPGSRPTQLKPLAMDDIFIGVVIVDLVDCCVCSGIITILYLLRLSAHLSMSSSGPQGTPKACICKPKYLCPRHTLGGIGISRNLPNQCRDIGTVSLQLWQQTAWSA